MNFPERGLLPLWATVYQGTDRLGPRVVNGCLTGVLSHFERPTGKKSREAGGTLHRVLPGLAT